MKSFSYEMFNDNVLCYSRGESEKGLSAISKEALRPFSLSPLVLY